MVCKDGAERRKIFYQCYRKGVAEESAEAIEGIIHKNKFTEEFFNKPISELPLPDGCVIAAVIRGDEVYMHSKDLLLKPNDKIIVFILGKTDKEKIENLFLTD